MYTPRCKRSLEVRPFENRADCKVNSQVAWRETRHPLDAIPQTFRRACNSLDASEGRKCEECLLAWDSHQIFVPPHNFCRKSSSILLDSGRLVDERPEEGSAPTRRYQAHRGLVVEGTQ